MDLSSARVENSRFDCLFVSEVRSRQSVDDEFVSEFVLDVGINPIGFSCLSG